MTDTPRGADAEVVVVGAGPVGLSLALGLARAGRRVLVLEKNAGTAEHSRAPAIWPRTQEILSALGVIDDFRSGGIELPRIRLRDARSDRVLLSLPLEELAGETDYPQLLIVPQSETERLLHEAVVHEPGAEVLFSAEVTAVHERGTGVRVTFRGTDGERTVEAPFAVGCDGAHSTVRSHLEATFDGVTYGTRAALADVRIPGAGDLPFPRIATRDGLAVGIRIDRRLWRLILPFPARDDLPLGERVARAVGALFPGLQAETPDFETVWQSEFRLHRRVSSRFVRGRIALAGDAGHLNSPAGGQGMNAGMQDAEKLIDVLPRALDTGDPAPLDEYERARRRAIEGGVNPFTDRLTRALLFGGGRMIRPVLGAARLALRLGPVRRRFLRRIAMLDAGEKG